jgi:hypothetical protein
LLDQCGWSHRLGLGRIRDLRNGGNLRLRAAPRGELLGGAGALQRRAVVEIGAARLSELRYGIGGAQRVRRARALGEITRTALRAIGQKILALGIGLDGGRIDE